jgi:hypothetical protein
MAFPTSVNSAVTDSITQANLGVLGVAPAVAMGELYLATSQALANSAANATKNQQENYIMAGAATAVGVALLNKVAASMKK